MPLSGIEPARLSLSAQHNTTTLGGGKNRRENRLIMNTRFRKRAFEIDTLNVLLEEQMLMLPVLISHQCFFSFFLSFLSFPFLFWSFPLLLWLKKNRRRRDSNLRP